MKSKVIFLSATALAVGFIAWLGYVAKHWPTPVAEIDIPPGKVELIPGTHHKGVLFQGRRDGLSVWQRVTPPTSNEVAEVRAMVEAMKNVQWPK